MQFPTILPKNVVFASWINALNRESGNSRTWPVHLKQFINPGSIKSAGADLLGNEEILYLIRSECEVYRWSQETFERLDVANFVPSPIGFKRRFQALNELIASNVQALDHLEIQSSFRRGDDKNRIGVYRFVNESLELLPKNVITDKLLQILGIRIAIHLAKEDDGATLSLSERDMRNVIFRELDYSARLCLYAFSSEH